MDYGGQLEQPVKNYHAKEVSRFEPKILCEPTKLTTLTKKHECV